MESFHPIQLLNVSVEELHLKIIDRELLSGDYPREFGLTVGRSDYNSEDKTIAVRMLMEIEPVFDENGNSDRPFEMKICICGYFDVDDTAFPVDKVHDWAEKNAPVILIPYMRENAYSLSLRCGIEPVIFPLVQVPTFKIAPPDKK